MLSIKLSTFYFCYFSLLGIMAPYLGLFLEDRGFTLLEIAQLASLLMLTKIVAPNIWGALADHFENRLLLVRSGAMATIVCFIFFFFAETFWHFAVVIVCFSFFWNAILPQFEVITLFNLGEGKERYGLIRLWGSIGFIISVVLAGWIYDLYGIEWFSLSLLIVVVAIFVSTFLSLAEPKANPASVKDSRFSVQLFQKPVITFFVMCFLLQLSHGAYYTYFSIYLEALDYSKREIGILWSLGVIAEVVLFVFMHHWFRRHSIRLILVIALLLTSIRWVIISEWPSVLLLLVLAQVLHAMSFGAMHASSINYVHKVFNESNQGRAQALYSSVGFGAGGAAGAYLSGLIVNFYDYSVAFLLSALIALLAAVLIATQGLEKIQD